MEFGKFLEKVSESVLARTSGNVDLEDILGMVDDRVILTDEWAAKTDPGNVANKLLRAAGFGN